MPLFPIVSERTPPRQSRYSDIAKRIDPDLRSLASSLLSVDLVMLLDPNMRETYRNLSIVIAVHESFIGLETNIDLDGIEYFDALWLRIQYHLTTFSSSSYFRQDSDVQKICRVLVPLFVAHSQLGIHRHTAVTESLVEQLLEVLRSLDLERCWRSYPNLMMWAFMFGTYTCADNVRREWFLFTLVNGARGKMLWDWENVRRILLGYFYLDRLYQDEFKKITEEVGMLL